MVMVVIAVVAAAPPVEALLFTRLGMFFLAGVACYVYRDQLPLDLRLLAAVVVVSLLLYRTMFFMTMFRVALGYAVLLAAFLARGRIVAYNRAPDCSYGVYIYGFPCQQALTALVPGIGAWTLFAAAMLVTVPLALLSWTFIERPALALKGRRSAVTSAPPVIAGQPIP